MDQDEEYLFSHISAQQADSLNQIRMGISFIPSLYLCLCLSHDSVICRVED